MNQGFPLHFLHTISNQQTGCWKGLGTTIQLLCSSDPTLDKAASYLLQFKRSHVFSKSIDVEVFWETCGQLEVLVGKLHWGVRSTSEITWHTCDYSMWVLCNYQRSHDMHVTIVCESYVTNYVACRYKAEEAGHSWPIGNQITSSACCNDMYSWPHPYIDHHLQYVSDLFWKANREGRPGRSQHKQRW